MSDWVSDLWLEHAINATARINAHFEFRFIEMLWNYHAARLGVRAGYLLNAFEHGVWHWAGVLLSIHFSLDLGGGLAIPPSLPMSKLSRIGTTRNRVSKCMFETRNSHLCDAVPVPVRSQT